MRTREEIVKSEKEMLSVGMTQFDPIVIELLLDIRDLLTHQEQ